MGDGAPENRETGEIPVAWENGRKLWNNRQTILGRGRRWVGGLKKGMDAGSHMRELADEFALP